MNFKQSSYEVMEDRGEVMIVIILSKPWHESLNVRISLMEDTATSE